MASRIEIDLLGTHFILSSDHNGDYLKDIFSNYKKCLQKVQSEIDIKDPLKIAIIAGIVASEMSINCYQSSKNDDIILEKSDSSYSIPIEDAQAIDSITKNLIKKINNCMKSK